MKDSILGFLNRGKSYLFAWAISLGAVLILLMLLQIKWIVLLYTALFSTFLLAIFLSIGVYSYHKQILVLGQVEKEIGGKDSTLPDTNDKLELCYQQIITKLQDHNQKQMEKQLDKEKQQQDYYTLWVHQIKVPIAAMDLLLKSPELDPSKLRQELFAIRQYSQMALGYIRLDSMESDIVLKEYNLREIVHELVKDYSTFFIYNEISLKLENLDYTFITDKKWFVFACSQLLMNAIQYTEKGSITIAFQKEPQPILCIRDTGIGIESTDLPRIFQRGFTGYTGRLNRKASGLGLFLCKEVLDNLSHSIAISSKVNEGTTVCVSLSRTDIVFE